MAYYIKVSIRGKRDDVLSPGYDTREDAVADLDKVSPAGPTDHSITQVDWLRVRRAEILSSELLEQADASAYVA